MKRVTILGMLVAIGSLSIAVMAAQPQKKAPPEPHADNISVEKVKDNLFVLRGGGGNTAVFVTAKGVTLVDTKNPRWGQPLLDKVKTLTDKPVTLVINTHTHYDHNSGNVEMPASAEIVTHATTAKLMTQMNPVTGLGSTPNVFKDNPGKGMPKRTFTDKHDDRHRAPTRSTSITSGPRTPAATRSSRSRRTASCTSATRSRTRACRSWTRTTAAPASSTPTPPQGGEGRAEHRHRSSTATRRRTRRPPTCCSSRTSSRDFVAHVQAGKKAGKTRRGGRQGLVDAGEIHRLRRRARRAARRSLRAGDLRRDEVGR